MRPGARLRRRDRHGCTAIVREVQALIRPESPRLATLGRRVFRLVNELRDQSPTSLMHALADDGLTLSGHRRASDEPVTLGRVSDDPHDADEISDADLVNTA